MGLFLHGTNDTPPRKEGDSLEVGPFIMILFLSPELPR